MTAGTRVEVENPFRKGSKLWDIFRFMADGERHSIEDLVESIYGPGTQMCHWTPTRRRMASALRTIRAKPGLDVEFDGTCYRLVEMPKTKWGYSHYERLHPR